MKELDPKTKSAVAKIIQILKEENLSFTQTSDAIMLVLCIVFDKGFKTEEARILVDFKIFMKICQERVINSLKAHGWK